MVDVFCARREGLRLRFWMHLASIRKYATAFSLGLLLTPGSLVFAQAKLVTTTALTIAASAGSNAIAPLGTVVTLTAAVSESTGSVTQGRVDFCDASAKFCTDIHLLGSAQLNSSGSATVKIRPGIGNHSYKAVFAGTTAATSSSSSSAAFMVTGLFPVNTTVALSGVPGGYTLTATIAGIINVSSTTAPIGTVSFLDTNNGNAVLTSVPVGSGTPGFSFFNSSKTAVKQEANAVAVADFNGDGIFDLAVSDSNSGQTLLAILLGKGDGTFTPVATSPAVGLYPDSIAVADYNSDGIADLAVTSVDDNLVTILLGIGDGTFRAVPHLSTVTTPQSVTTGDYNGDGIPDLAVVNAKSILIFLGKGDGSFQAAPATLPTGLSAITVVSADFNGDGNVDLAVVNNCGNASLCNPSTVWIYLGKGDGTFTKVPTIPTTGSGSVGLSVGDFNGDGIPDLAVTNYGAYSGGPLAILLGKGDGTFNEAVFYSVPGLNFKSVAIADYNGDGIADLAVGEFWHGLFGMLLGKGDGTFSAGTGFSSQAQLGSGYIAAADFNGDGLPDLVLPSQDGTVPVVLAQPSQTVTGNVSGIAPGGPGIHQVAANYPGDSNYSAGISSTVALTAALKPVTISLPSGTYPASQTVNLSESIPGSTILYSISGTTLNTNGFVPYTGPISLSNGGVESLQVYATATGYQQSAYANATYTLNLPATATPSLSLASGYYAKLQAVTITDSDASTRIYYTTNGSTPTTSSNLYTGPVVVSSSETVVAIALSSGHSYSAAASAQYVIGTSSVPLIYSIAGTGMAGYSGNGGPASLAQLNYASAIAKDTSGNVYIADTGNHMVRMIAAGTGIISVVAGNGITGNSGDGQAATSATMSSPANLLLDNGNLFINDVGYYVIRKVDLSTGIITTYAGSATATSLGEGGAATAASLGYVGGLAVDAAHNLYLAETSLGMVRRVSASTGIISTIAGSGRSGFSGDGGPASGASFSSIYGLAFDASGSLYIADARNGAIRKVSSTGGIITSSSIVSTVAGTPPNGYYGQTNGPWGDGNPATSATLSQPTAVAFDQAGNLFILDQSHEVVREVFASTGIISTVVGNGVYCGASGDGGAATSASLCAPLSMAVDISGTIYISDYSDRIREIFLPTAPPSVQAATPTFNVTGGTYASPLSVAISDSTPGTSIYVSVDGTAPTTDSPGYSLPLTITGTVTLKAIAIGPGDLASAPASATYTVSAFAPIITTVAGTGMSGFSTAPGPASSIMFQAPTGLAIDKAGNMYVSDLVSHVIWKISASTGIAAIFAGTGRPSYTGDGGPAASATLYYPSGLALDSSGNLYVADSANNAVRKITAATGIISTYAGLNQNYSSTIGDGGPATSAQLQGPSAIAFDAQNNLFIADRGNYRIREVLATTGIINTVAGNGSYFASGDGGAATNAGVLYPDSIAVDAADNLYISSASGARVRKVTAATGVIDTIAGIADLPGQTGDGGPATSAEVSPRALLLDAAGNLYISNSPGEIRKLNTSNGIISNVAGIGYPGYSGDGGAAADAQIMYPTQAAFDTSGNLYFVESDYRVRKVTLEVQDAASPAFSIPAGTYSVPQSVVLTSKTPNANIYYTTDGSTPTISSNLYTAPITLNSSATINAFSTALGYRPSAVSSAAYVIIVQAPAPFITSLSPAYSTAGGAAFKLTVNGSGFAKASTILWNSSALTTQFVDSTQLTATVPASAISSAGVTPIAVQTPAPGGGTSHTLQFEIDTAGASTPPSFSAMTATVTAGATATYPVSLPSSATNVSVRCLNLPSGAACSYSSSTGALMITTSSTTSSGSYLVTAVFAETLPGAALASLLLPLLLLPIAKTNRHKNTRSMLLLLFTTIASLGFLVGCGGAGSAPAPPATHQATSSGAVTLIIN